jgi:hypothetical protein
MSSPRAFTSSARRRWSNGSFASAVALERPNDASLMQLLARGASTVFDLLHDDSCRARPFRAAFPPELRLAIVKGISQSEWFNTPEAAAQIAISAYQAIFDVNLGAPAALVKVLSVDPRANTAATARLLDLDLLVGHADSSGRRRAGRRHAARSSSR